MATFNEANHARLSLKMTLSRYHWYNGSSVLSKDGDYYVVIHASKLDDGVRKIVPIVHKDVSIKVDGVQK